MVQALQPRLGSCGQAEAAGVPGDRPAAQWREGEALREIVNETCSPG